MGDLRAPQGQRHRQVWFGREWDFEGRFEEWQRAVILHPTGRDHLRDEDKSSDEILENLYHR